MPLTFLRRAFGGRSEQDLERTENEALQKINPLDSNGEPSEKPITGIAHDKAHGAWDGMVAPPKNTRGALGVPHWLVKYGMSAWALIGLAIVVSGIVYMLGMVSEVFLAVFLAFVLTSVMLPAVNWLDKYMPRVLATVLALIGSFSCLAGFSSISDTPWPMSGTTSPDSSKTAWKKS